METSTNTSTELVLERRDQDDRTVHFGAASLTPRIDEGYWQYRVRLTKRQSIVGFPKFSTIGIGFAVEDDWNTNLPYTCSAEEIVDHIWHNRLSKKKITKPLAIEAVRLIQQAATADRAAASA